jgi:hypothetical protein
MTRDVTSFAPAKATWCSRRPGLGVCKPAIAAQPPPDRPDPAIYSQAPLLAAGGTATWDNPDIVLYATPQHTSGGWSIAPQWFLYNALVPCATTPRPQRR